MNLIKMKQKYIYNPIGLLAEFTEVVYLICVGHITIKRGWHVLTGKARLVHHDCCIYGWG